MKKSKSALNFAALQLIFLLYSFIGISTKIAAQYTFMSFYFCLFYGISLFNMFIYAIVWQHILKQTPLIVAYSNRAVIILWGMLWGWIVFGEEFNWAKIAGAIIVVTGVLFVVSDEVDK